jgi:hypothetical protein
MTEIYQNWHPIDDLPDNYMTLTNTEFRKIANEWYDVKAKINGSVFTVFLERLNREWAIELGQVENLYLLNEGITKTLIEHGLQSVELAHQNGGFDIVDPALLLQSHSDIINGIYQDVRLGTPINKYMIRGMHAALTEFQDFAPGIDYFGRKKEFR